MFVFSDVARIDAFGRGEVGVRGGVVNEIERWRERDFASAEFALVYTARIHTRWATTRHRYGHVGLQSSTLQKHLGDRNRRYDSRATRHNIDIRIK